MKLQRALLLPLTLTVLSLTGCNNRKVRYDTFRDVFSTPVPEYSEATYYFDEGFGSLNVLEDCDSYMRNEMIKLEAPKRYTKPDKSSSYFTYHYYYTFNNQYRNTHFTFYINGSIVVEDNGSNIRDSYNYFTVSTEDMAAFFKLVEERFEYAAQVIEEDKERVKNEFTIDAFVEHLKDKKRIDTAVVNERGNRRVYEDGGVIRDMIANTEFEYQQTTQDYISDAYITLIYNSTSLYDHELHPWFFAMDNSYKTVYLIYVFNQDRVGRRSMQYQNVYTISREAGLAFYKQATGIL